MAEFCTLDLAQCVNKKIGIKYVSMKRSQTNIFHQGNREWK